MARVLAADRAAPSRQSFDLPWEPTAKGRPRATRKGIVYTPTKTRHAEAAIRYLLVDKGAHLFERAVPLAVAATFYVHRPASAPRRVVLPVKRPDLDQYVKLVLDAGTGVLWHDDAQIVYLQAWKRFAIGGPHIELAVWETEP